MTMNVIKVNSLVWFAHIYIFSFHTQNTMHNDGDFGSLSLGIAVFFCATAAIAVARLK